MKILHVLDHSIPLHSGYTFRSRNIIQHQREQGWQTAHVTGLKQGPVELEEEEVDGLRFYRTRVSPGVVGRVPVVNQWQVVKTLEQRILQVAAKEQPDLLHAHSPALNGLAALRAGKSLGLPVVYECRAFWEDAAVDHGTSREWGLRYRLTRALESRVFQQVDAVTTICEGLREEIVSRGVPSGKVTVIPNAVDTNNFTFNASAPEELQSRLGLAGKTVLGFIGSFYAYEGVPLLLQALPDLRREFPELRFLLVGGGPEEEAIHRLIGDAGLGDMVVTTGRVPHEQVQDYYNLVDVFVYPRLPMRLTELVTPLKPLEAMAQGRLVVASDVGGHRELIRPGFNGVLFPAGDSSALARTLADLLHHRDNWQLMRQQGREYVEHERTWVNSVSRYRHVYEGLL